MRDQINSVDTFETLDAILGLVYHSIPSQNNHILFPYIKFLTVGVDDSDNNLFKELTFGNPFDFQKEFSTSYLEGSEFSFLSYDERGGHRNHIDIILRHDFLDNFPLRDDVDAVSSSISLSNSSYHVNSLLSFKSNLTFKDYELQPYLIGVDVFPYLSVPVNMSGQRRVFSIINGEVPPFDYNQEEVILQPLSNDLQGNDGPYQFDLITSFKTDRTGDKKFSKIELAKINFNDPLRIDFSSSNSVSINETFSLGLRGDINNFGQDYVPVGVDWEVPVVLFDGSSYILSFNNFSKSFKWDSENYYSELNYQNLSLGNLNYGYGLSTTLSSSVKVVISYQNKKDPFDKKTYLVNKGSMEQGVEEVSTFFNLRPNPNTCNVQNPYFMNYPISGYDGTVYFKCESCNITEKQYYYISDPEMPRCVYCPIDAGGELDQNGNCIYKPVTNESIKNDYPEDSYLGSGWTGYNKDWYFNDCNEFHNGERIGTPFPGLRDVFIDYHYTCTPAYNRESIRVKIGQHNCWIDEDTGEKINKWIDDPDVPDFVEADCGYGQGDPVPLPNY